MAFTLDLDTLPPPRRRRETRFVRGRDDDERLSLGTGRTQEQVQGLVYPGQSGKLVSAASERNPELLRAFDDRGYWDIYKMALRMSALRFSVIHLITGMSKGNGRVLFQVLDYVVDWLNPKRTIVLARRDNPKSPLRGDLELALDYFSPTRPRDCLAEFHRVSTWRPSQVHLLRERFVKPETLDSGARVLPYRRVAYRSAVSPGMPLYTS